MRWGVGVGVGGAIHLDLLAYDVEGVLHDVEVNEDFHDGPSFCVVSDLVSMYVMGTRSVSNSGIEDERGARPF